MCVFGLRSVARNNETGGWGQNQMVQVAVLVVHVEGNLFKSGAELIVVCELVIRRPKIVF